MDSRGCTDDVEGIRSVSKIQHGCACTRLYPNIMSAEACRCRGDRWRAVEAHELDMLTQRLFTILSENEEMRASSSVFETVTVDATGGGKVEADGKAGKQSEQRDEAHKVCSPSEGSSVSSGNADTEGWFPGCSMAIGMVERFPLVPLDPTKGLDQSTLSKASDHPHQCIPCKFYCYSFSGKCKYGSSCHFCHMQHGSNRMNRKMKSRLAQGKKIKGINSI